MKHNTPYRVVLAGLLASMGVLLPFITGHAFGVPGTVLLPMHIPVFLIGLLCGPQLGAMGGLIIPAVSSLLTGMPVAFPMLPIMMGELFTYGLVSGLLYQKTKMPLYPSMLIAMVSGRIVYGLIFSVLLMANNGVLKALSVWAAVLQGLPGIAIQLILIPVIVAVVKRNSHMEIKQKQKVSETDLLKEAQRMIKNAEASCVVIKNNTIRYKANGRGVAPLLSLYENERTVLKDAFAVDKVIGKAAAMLLVLGGVKRVYGELMSTSAYTYLCDHGIQAEYGRCVDIISNRTGNGICPLEKSVLDVDDPETGYHILNETISQLRNIG